MKHFILFILLSFLTVSSFAQQGAEMADTMRSSGKIYVVVAVIAVVFVGIAVFLFSLDRRLKKIERNS
ncbi:CcmD family protein [Pedobacter sp. HMF7647]|uniref:CcmD family protein n=1 Tax=Hufsiella arboris TaxID=2695275 RepID=A0A7K1YBU1_9SPHI|nr:CcmD family protein [Hufsiella arboris]MXV51549.1 CcmD family protein [Hufsiella arboris]